MKLEVTATQWTAIKFALHNELKSYQRNLQIAEQDTMEEELKSKLITGLERGAVIYKQVIDQLEAQMKPQLKEE